jgi:hypothetical protein
VLLGKDPFQTNLVICHLGNGSSVNAVKNGCSFDTSMGITPLEGLIMGTRAGDADLAMPFYVMRKTGMSADEMESALNKKSGLLGLTGKHTDRRDIQKAALAGDKKALLSQNLRGIHIGFPSPCGPLLLIGIAMLIITPVGFGRRRGGNPLLQYDIVAKVEPFDAAQAEEGVEAVQEFRFYGGFVKLAEAGGGKGTKVRGGAVPKVFGVGGKFTGKIPVRRGEGERDGEDNRSRVGRRGNGANLAQPGKDRFPRRFRFRRALRKGAPDQGVEASAHQNQREQGGQPQKDAVRYEEARRGARFFLCHVPLWGRGLIFCNNSFMVIVKTGVPRILIIGGIRCL